MTWLIVRVSVSQMTMDMFPLSELQSRLILINNLPPE